MVSSSLNPTDAAATLEIVVFVLDERDFALPLACVHRVVRMVEAKPLPSAPPVVLGLIEIAGEVLPLLDVRFRFGLMRRPPASRDRIIIARTRRRRVALAVDEVAGLVALDTGVVVPAAEVVPGLAHVAGIARVPGRDLVLIHDLERFLSLEEEHALDSALAHGT